MNKQPYRMDPMFTTKPVQDVFVVRIFDLKRTQVGYFTIAGKTKEQIEKIMNDKYPNKFFDISEVV